MELRAFAEQILLRDDLDDKLRPPEEPLSDHSPGDPFRPVEPARPANLQFAPRRTAPAMAAAPAMTDPEKRAIAHHIMANHELQAVEVMAFVLVAFPEAPREFRLGLVEIIQDEQRHTRMHAERASMLGVAHYLMNKADINQINRDVDILASTYHNLGYLTATVGRRITYDETGKWLTVTFVINEGQRFKINRIQIVGNQFVLEDSLRDRLELKPGDMFDGTLMKRDVGEIVYGYGELGFIYAEVKPQTVMRDEENTVDLVYQISEGDRWKIGQIRVNIEGEPHLMRETVMLNMLDLREGDYINRRLLEVGRRRILNSQLLETNPQVADPPDIIVEPIEEAN